MGKPDRGVGLAGGREQRDRFVWTVRPPGHPSGPLAKLGTVQRCLGEVERSLEVPLRLAGSRERGRAVARLREDGPGALGDLRRVFGVRRRLVGADEVRGEDLHDLVLVIGELALDERGRSEVLRLAVTPGEGLVGDGPQEVLEEEVLASLGRPRVGLQREDLLADERGERLVELGLAGPHQLRQTGLEEALAEHRSVLDRAPLLRGEAVQACRDQCMQRLRDVDLPDLARDAVDPRVLRQGTSVEEHPYGLDGVEGDALRSVAYPLLDLLGKAGHVAREEPMHRVLGERLQVEGGEVPLRGAPVGAMLPELRAREREDEDRRGSRPLEQILDEVEERCVGPLEVLEHHRDGQLLGHPLEELPPRREQVLPVPRLTLLEPEEMGQARFDPRALLGVGDDLLEGDVELPPGFGRRLVLHDPGPHADLLGECPVRDTLAVG